MQNGETPPTSNSETNPATGSENPWSKMAEEAPPFGNGEKQSTDTSEISENSKAESDDYYTFEGVEYRNIEKIDISTDQGKFEWLDSLVGNASARLESEQENIISEEGLYGMDKKEQEEYLGYNDAWQDNKRESDLVRRQGKILENLDFDGEGGVLGAIERKRNAFAETMNNPNASQHAQEVAMQNWDAASNLYMILAGEMARRDPDYFGQAEMESTLKSEIRSAERRVEQTMVDGYFGEDGFIHKSPNGEKMPSAATEDAEIDLRNAKQDAETFGLLMNNYQAANDYMAPRAIKKEDFAPTIDEFIEDHTKQINQLAAESKTLTKGTAEYAENEAKRRQLAKERSSARRLNARYFNIPRTEASADTSTPETPTTETDSGDDEMSVEQVPFGKSSEQTETKIGEHQQEEPPKTYHFEGGLVDKDVTITVGQEIPNEWFESRTYEDGTENGFGINIIRSPRIDDFLSQALNIEFGKLSEDERRQYNYSVLSKAIMAEAKRTKRVPDIASIMSRERAINDQRKKVEQSYGQGANQQIEEELEDEMSM